MAPHAEQVSHTPTGDLPLTSGFKSYPKFRDDALKNAELWLKGKAEVDGAYPYWRIHDKLYDMTPFIDKHPGGKFWIEATRGTDITESFESSHFGTGPEKILAKHFVKNATTPRNSPFTFEQDGFYKTLKRKVTPILAKVGKGPSWSMLLIQDSLLFGFLLFFFLTARYNSVNFALIGGVFACLGAIASHNFFHQKDNWRMYIFDLTLLGSRDWRISHALSHHVFPNTIYDFEISGFEPILEFLPRKNKSFIYRKSALLIFQIFCCFGFYFDLFMKTALMISGKIKARWSDSITPLQIAILVVSTSSLSRGIWLWFVLQLCCNIVFLLIGLTAAHHHPDIYHEGDIAPSNKDWGLLQLAATREKMEVMSSLLLVSITFGNHTLHHLFPTVDHSKLPYLMPALLETCKEFGVKFEMFTIWQHVKGSLAQIALTKPNSKKPKCLT